MNKILPIILVVVIGLGVIAGAFFFFKKDGSTDKQNAKEEAKEEAAKELPLEEKPFVTLTPRADGHEFHLTIEKVPQGVGAVEYELVYKNADGVTQGVPGSIKYKQEKLIERDLLLGSCSSGKCKYDDGVEDGTFTLKLRNSDGKLITKMETGFRLWNGGSRLVSADEKFALTSDKGTFPKGYYLVMGTFGLPASITSNVESGPYGVFSKASSKVTATVSLGSNIEQYINGKWTKLEGGKSASIGTFISTK